MNVIVKGSFDRDIAKAKDKKLRLALSNKISQIENAKDISSITGLKLFAGLHTSLSYRS